MFGCTAGSGSDSYTVPEDTVSFDVPNDITEEMFAAKDDADLQQADVSPQKKERIVVATSDYSKGSVYLFNEGFPLSATKILDEGSVGGDIVLRGFGGTLAVTNRYGADRVQLFSAAEGFEMLHDFYTGSGSNPQDALLNGATLYVSVYSTKDFEGNPIILNDAPIGDILAFDTAGKEPAAAVSLEEFSLNGQPNAATLVFAGGYIFAVMQDLEGFTPTVSGKLAVIDPALNDVVSAIELDCRNPYDMVYSEELGEIFIACAGDFMALDEADAGIEAVDVASRKSLGLLLTELDIGNNATKVRIVSEGLGAVATSNFNGTDISFVSTFDPVAGTMIEERVYGTELTNIADILVDGGGLLWIADRDSAQGGVVCVDPENGQIMGAMTTFEAPPVSLATIMVTEK